MRVINIWTKVNNNKEAGSTIPSLVALGEWVLSANKQKLTRGHLQFKTIQIKAKDGSVFDLIIEDTKRNTLRSIKSSYVIGRKPMVYGQAKYMRTFIYNNDPVGFSISTVSFEGNYNTRSKRI